MWPTTVAAASGCMCTSVTPLMVLFSESLTSRFSSSFLGSLRCEFCSRWARMSLYMSRPPWPTMALRGAVFRSWQILACSSVR